MPIPKSSLKWVLFSCCLLFVIGAWGLQSYWVPSAKIWAAKQLVGIDSGKNGKEGKEGKHDHAGHDHAGHDESSSLELSPQAMKNVGLTKENVRAVKLQSFTRTISVPAIVVERPGRTRIKIVAPMTGIVTNTNIISGEAITPGRQLFNLRLTHEDMVKAQASFLKSLGDLDVENKEIKRLKGATANGAIPKKVLLARIYAKQKIEVALSTQRESLFLHGFSKEQVDSIAKSRRLIRNHTIIAPTVSDQSGEVRSSTPAIRTISASEKFPQPSGNTKKVHTYVVQELTVNKGDFVSAGDTLCVLIDYRELYIQGRAFEQDAEELNQANNNNWDVKAVLENRSKQKKVIGGLKIAYFDNRVEENSRAFHFYIDLPNKKIGDKTTSDGHRFLTWKFKPGQRLQLLVPVEKWKNQIVLPVEAVASSGADRYVFQQNGSHFDRRPVHVIYQDQLSVVIENDGSVFPGDIIAYTGAHQLQMALVNKAGGGVDPHAGHNH